MLALYYFKLVPLFWLLTIVATLLTPINGQRHEGSDLPEDCDKDQYYDIEQSKCRNCSDALHLLFDMNNQLYHKDWTKINGAILESTSHNSKSQGATGSRSTPSSTLNDGQAGAAVLSRLIANVEPASDYSQADELLSSDQDNNHDGQDDISTREHHLLNQLPADPENDIIQSNKQAQKFLDRFAQSSAIGQDLLESINQCKQYKNSSACQMWSNFCVLSMYSHSSDSKQSLIHHNNREPRVTWQQCPQFTINSICNSLRMWHRMDKKIGPDIADIYANEDEPMNKFGLSISLRINQVIQLLAYIHSYNGQLIRVSQFDLSYMDKFCVISQIETSSDKNNNYIMPINQQQYLRVGQNMQLKCQLSQFAAANLPKHLNETIFIDLYIGYQSNGAMFIKPVPILIKNLMLNGNQINRKYAQDPSRWKLVHRFFYKSIYRLDDQNKSDKSKDKHDDILIYTKQADLEFKFKKQERSGGLILSSLLLTLDYEQTSVKSLLIKAGHQDNNTSPPHSSFTSTEPLLLLESSVTIKQTLIDMQSYKKEFDLVITIICILSSILSLIKCYNIQKCHGIVKLDIYSLFLFIVVSCDIIANILSLVTLIVLAFLFLALKFQIGLQVFAPNDELENTFLINFQIAFVFKLIGMIYKLYVRLRADIFFIDWERPKMLTSAQILNHHHSAFFNNNKNSQLDKNVIINNNNNNLIKQASEIIESSPSVRDSLSQQQQTSFWRPYTVINRWIQLQTKRRLDMTLQLILFACLIDFSQLTNLATADSNWDVTWLGHNNIPRQQQFQTRQMPHLIPCTSLTFRLLILSFVYLSLALIQILFKKYFYESMIRNLIREFVDLCSVANVSLFSMLYPRFGYYIHGRNANGSGDCSILEMNALLEREERDLCSRRGLAPNSDHQTFVLILPKIINDHYRKLLFRNDQVTPFNQFKKQSGDKFVGNQQQQQQQSQSGGDSLLKSALNLSSSFAPIGLSASSATSFSSHRMIIETVVARNKAINLFLTNFLDHIYKDIDYSIRERRRFESILLDVDFGYDDETATPFGSRSTSGTPPAPNGPLAGTPSNQHEKFNTAATFCVDHQDSFASLLWLGIEWDLILMELFSLLTLDLWLGQPELIVTVSLVWLIEKLFKAFYLTCARNNLITKAMVDEKFLSRS